MDYVLFAILFFFAAKGLFKGFLSMLFSVFGAIFVFFLAWQFCDELGEVLAGLFGSSLESEIANTLNNSISGEFSSAAEVLAAVSGSSFATFFGAILEKILGDLSFEGSLSAGQIFAPSLTTLALRVAAFILLFVAFFVILKIVFALLAKFVFSFNLTGANRLLGLLFGAVFGLAIFGVAYFSLLALSNFVLCDWLSALLQSGKISSFLYENLFSRVVEFFG